MTLKRYDFEAGTEGAAVTVSNIGADTVSNPGGAGAITFNAASRGTGSYGITMAAGGSNLIIRLLADTPNKVMAFAGTFKLDALPTSITPSVFGLRHATGTSVRLYVDPDGDLKVDGSPLTGYKELGVRIVAGVTYRVEMLVNTGTTGSDGSLKVRIFAGNSRTPLATEYSSSAFTVPANPITGADLLVDAGYTLRFDDIRLNDGSTTWPGPPLPTAAPTNSARPWEIIENEGGFVNVGGAAYPALALADESDATYLQSPASPVDAKMVISLNPPTSGPLTIKLRHRATEASPTISRTITLLQGTTVITTRTTALTTSWVDYSFTTTEPETAAIISPRDNLYIEIEDS